jgi:hypothetical protein
MNCRNFSTSSSANGSARAYTLAFRNGIIEAVTSVLTEDGKIGIVRARAPQRRHAAPDGRAAIQSLSPTPCLGFGGANLDFVQRETD